MNSLPGIAVVLLAVALPGAALVRGASFSWLEWFGRIVAVSIAFNGICLMVFNFLGLWHPEAARLWLLILIGVTVGIGAMRVRAGRWSAPQRLAEREAWLLPIFFIVGWKSALFPFFSWDAIASWNRWAESYFLQADFFRNQDFFYAQLHPWLMSVPYLALRTVGDELPSHCLSFAYLLVLYAGVASLARALDANRVLAMALLFAGASFPVWAASGYADTAASAFVTLAWGIFLGSMRASPGAGEGARELRRVFVAGLFGGTALLFKLSASGMVIGLALTSLVTLPGGRFARGRRSLVFVAGNLVVVGPWILSPHTTLFPSQFAYVMSGIHEGAGIGEILDSGFETLLASMTVLRSRALDFIALAFSIGAIITAARHDGRARMAAVVLTGWTLVWIASANYSTRALMPALPVAAVLVARGGRLATGRLGLVWRRSLAGVATASLLAVFLAFEWLAASGLPGEARFEPRAGTAWWQVSPRASAQEKRVALFPMTGAIADFRSAHPDFAHTLWGNAVFLRLGRGAPRDTRVAWIGALVDPAGRTRWREGDVLLLADADLRGPASMSGGRLGVGDLVARGLSGGRLGIGRRFGEYREYRVRDAPGVEGN